MMIIITTFYTALKYIADVIIIFMTVPIINYLYNYQ